MDISSASTMVPVSRSSSSLRLAEKSTEPSEQDLKKFTADAKRNQKSTTFERDYQGQTAAAYSSMTPRSKAPFKVKLKAWFAPEGELRPFRLLRQDIRNLGKRYVSDWTLFNQLVFASAVYVFFTNILPGITFASDLYVLTGMTWGTIEVVFSTGLCGVIFSL